MPILFEPGSDFLQRSVHVADLVANNGAADQRVLPLLQIIDFSSRYVELFLQTSQQRFEPVSLGFERVASWELDMQEQKTDFHFLAARNAASIIASMEKLRPWLPVIAIVVLVGIVAYGAYQVLDVVRDTAQAGLSPVQDVANSISTEVANVLHPTPTIIPDPVTIIHEVRSLARLETIQYSVEKIITAESRQGIFGFLVGDKILFVAHGMVIAGVDLEKLQPDDMRVEDGVLYVTLPDAEIFVATLNNDQSYIYDREQGFLTRGDQQLETAARRAAEEEILDSAIEDGILDQALLNAENFLYRFFLQLGFPDVIFER
jgi:hypothetical protein